MGIDELQRAVSAGCRTYDVKRLEVFGSVASESASPESDIDLLVEFRNPSKQLSKRYFGLLHTLEDTLKCEVDLLTYESLKNPYFKRRVLKEKVPVYEG